VIDVARHVSLWVERVHTTITSLAFLVSRKAGLSDKAPYRVMLKGEPLWLDLEGEIEQGGFYTTRWVFASSPEEAVGQVVSMVRREAQEFQRNPPESPLVIEVEEAGELASGIMTRRGGGFTFWSDDAQLDALEVETGANGTKH
jgi:hypothetical protein